MRQAKNKLLSLFTACVMLIAATVPLIPVAAAGETLTWTFDDAAPAGVMGGGKEWYIEDTDMGNGLTLKANAEQKDNGEYGNTIEIDHDASADFNGETVVGALKFGGSSREDSRFLIFEPEENGTLTVYVKHGSPNNSDERDMYVTQGDVETVIRTFGNGSDTPAPNVKQDVEIDAGKEVRITSGGNVHLAKLIFTPEGSNPEPNPQPSENTTPTAEVTVETASPAPTVEATEEAASPTPTATEEVAKPTETPSDGEYLSTHEWYPDSVLDADTEITDVPGLYTVGVFDRFRTSDKTFSDGTQTQTYITSENNNGGWANGTATGTALRFDAPADGVLVIYIIDVSNKDVYIAQQDCSSDKAGLPESAEAYIHVGSESTDLAISADVKGGETYYSFVDGSKGRFAGVKFFRTGDFIEKAPDQEIVEEVADNIQLGSVSQGNIYLDVALPSSGDERTEITWESSNPEYIDIRMVSHIKACWTGVVTRPKTSDPNLVDGGVPVTLTATVTKGEALTKRSFEVSVRAWNPIYYNDFQADVGQSAEGSYTGIQDNVTAANGDTFRGIRVDTLSAAKSMEGFRNDEHDLAANFDKRIMSTDAAGFDRPEKAKDEDENFAFYYSAYNPYGGQTTYTPLWIELIDPTTGSAPEGLVMLTMDILVDKTDHRFSMGFGTSSASQMCRFTIYSSDEPDSSLGYPGAGTLRYMSDTTTIEYMGGTGGYRVPQGEWVQAAIIANSQTHKWDFYFDGMLIDSGLDFRNAEDMISTIEFTMDRTAREGRGSYLIDNICVENITDDYVDRYWEDFSVYTLPYDENEQAYVLEKTNILPYMGRDALYGNEFSWRSSNNDVLRISKENVSIDELANYGYTEEQIESYRAQGLTEVTVIKAIPGLISEDTKVTLTGYLDMDGQTLGKSFDVVVKANTETQPSATLRPTMSPSSGGSGGGGGITSVQGNGGSMTVSNSQLNSQFVVNTPSATPRPAGTPIFNDVSAVPWAQEAIEYLYLKDIVNGYGDGTYGVNDNVTREQFVKMLITALGLNLYELDSNDFTDVEPGAWYEMYINSAMHYGIVNGISNTEFGVGQQISRQDMAVMSMRAIDFINGNTGEENLAENAVATATGSDSESDNANSSTLEKIGTAEDGLTSEEDAEYVRALFDSMTFIDKDEISDYAIESVARMVQNGYLNGDDTGKFRPLSSSTRSETAVMIYRIIQ